MMSGVLVPRPRTKPPGATWLIDVAAIARSRGLRVCIGRMAEPTRLDSSRAATAAAVATASPLVASATQNPCHPARSANVANSMFSRTVRPGDARSRRGTGLEVVDGVIALFRNSIEGSWLI